MICRRSTRFQDTLDYVNPPMSQLGGTDNRRIFICPYGHPISCRGSMAKIMEPVSGRCLHGLVPKIAESRGEKAIYFLPRGPSVIGASHSLKTRHPTQPFHLVGSWFPQQNDNLIRDTSTITRFTPLAPILAVGYLSRPSRHPRCVCSHSRDVITRFTLAYEFEDIIRASFHVRQRKSSSVSHPILSLATSSRTHVWT